jgi:hypothetical protein
MRTNFKPTMRFLIEVQAPTNLDYPAMIEPDLPIMHVEVAPDIQDDIEFKEALLQLTQFVL